MANAFNSINKDSFKYFMSRRLFERNQTKLKAIIKDSRITHSGERHLYMFNNINQAKLIETKVKTCT